MQQFLFSFFKQAIDTNGGLGCILLAHFNGSTLHRSKQFARSELLCRCCWGGALRMPPSLSSCASAASSEIAHQCWPAMPDSQWLVLGSTTTAWLPALFLDRSSQSWLAYILMPLASNSKQLLPLSQFSVVLGFRLDLLSWTRTQSSAEGGTPCKRCQSLSIRGRGAWESLCQPSAGFFDL